MPRSSSSDVEGGGFGGGGGSPDASKKRLRDDAVPQIRCDVEAEEHGAAGSSSCYNRGWFWAAALPAILILGVILPLAVTVAKQQRELAAAGGSGGLKATIKSAPPKMGGGGGDAGPPECSDLIHRGPSPLGNPPPALLVQGSRIVAGAGQHEVQFKGINMFGFNTGKSMVDGLDAGNSTWIASDFATIVYRLKLLGFNAVRLPFAFSDLDQPTQSYARQCTPAAPHGADVAAATILQEATRGRVPTPEEFLLPVGSASGTCNAYLPNAPTTLPRYLWVVQHLIANGLYVMIDYHPHAKEPQNLADPETYARKWHILWTALTCLPNYATDLKGRLLLDLLNEPDEYGLGWSGGSSKAGKRYAPLGAYLTAAMDLIEATSPGEPIFVVQGGGQARLGTAWGDGFVTDRAAISSLGLEDPNPFFTDLLTKPYRKRVVLSPHFYGLSVTGNTATGHQLWEKFTSSWGHLQAQGYCQGSDCQRFPVVIGEVGSFLRHPLDLQQLKDLAVYVQAQGPTDQPQFAHARASGWFWWAYNPESKDTGGIVAQDDHESLVWHKLTWLFTNLQLTPWWLRLDQPEPEPTFVQQQQSDSEAEEPAVTLFQAR